MSKYSVGKREAAAWNVQLDLQWGKTGLIMSVVLCTLVGCQQPTAACTGLHKNNSTRGLCQEGKEELLHEMIELDLSSLDCSTFCQGNIAPYS